MRWRRIGLSLGAAVAIVVVAAAGWFVWHSWSAARQLVNASVFDDRQLATDFTLTDQLGRTTQLSQFRGKAVALTFLYTNCPDVCPLIASNMHQAYTELGQQAQDVALVAVTVDPQRDTVGQLRQFSDQRGLTDEWSFLTGPPDQLAAVWKAYGILAQPADAQGRPVSLAAQRVAQGLVPPPDQIEHSAPVLIIDPSGATRATLPDDFTPDTLVTDLRVLVAGG